MKADKRYTQKSNPIAYRHTTSERHRNIECRCSEILSSLQVSNADQPELSGQNMLLVSLSKHGLHGGWFVEIENTAGDSSCEELNASHDKKTWKKLFIEPDQDIRALVLQQMPEPDRQLYQVCTSPKRKDGS